MLIRFEVQIELPIIRFDSILERLEQIMEDNHGVGSTDHFLR